MPTSKHHHLRVVPSSETGEWQVYREMRERKYGRPPAMRRDCAPAARAEPVRRFADVVATAIDAPRRTTSPGRWVLSVGHRLVVLGFVAAAMIALALARC